MNTVTGLLKRFDHLFYALMVVAAINIGVMGVFGTDIIGQVFSGSALTVVQVLIGVAGLLSLDKAIEKLSR